ncbi:hypothetical protein [Conexibacter sp. DBS9H8]|uniref:hypothetical protein n=1 Tax=Conexibacter sp. DBS9H8 TaxID=2937801 RepID=UPI00200E9F7E|nr:hypothetical protein [Conexibacter sp. DBS9H8]
MLHVTVSPAPGPRLAVLHACELVGDRVNLSGSGFAPDAPFDLAIDGVDFGQSLTARTGDFFTAVLPGGLPAGVAQSADTATATDGSVTASAQFTVTRPTGALFTAGAGSSPRRRVTFEAWDFAPSGPEVRLYLHYLAPSGRAAATVALGESRGQCGALIAPGRPLFPFRPTSGTWTLLIDTVAGPTDRPPGRVARLRVSVG